MREVLLFQALYQERIWGGRTLHARFGRALPPEQRVGESWEIVDRPEAQSVVRSGAWKGLTLREVIERHGASVMGPGWAASEPFPLLVKWLDCSDRLSLQVHPPAAVAAELGAEPKTENWYIAQTAPEAQIIVGLKPGMSPEEFEQAIASGTAEQCVCRFSVAAGDSILVKAGQVHAIDAGNLILEVQQNSDSTFRIYDWNRKDRQGNPRTLHIRESLKSILWNEGPPPLVRASPTSGIIADCDEFTIRRVVLGAGDTLKLKGGTQPRIMGVVAGSLSWEGGRLEHGDNGLVPYEGDFTFEALETAIVLVTEKFA